MSVSRVGATTTFSWVGAGLLQEATDIAGPWTDLTAARSPYTPAAGGPVKFYRLKR